MGASVWSYVVPYRPDINAALQQLRQDVYDRGDYYREPRDLAYLAMTEEEYVATLDPNWWDGGPNESLLEDWRRAKGAPEPVDPNTVAAAQPHSGTHSIIDMTGGV